MKITVVGLGLIGGSIAIDLRAAGISQRLIGVEENLQHCEQAMARNLVDEILPLASAVQTADCVILAVPVGAISRLLPAILDLVGPGTTVTDMGSTKSLIVKSVSTHKNRRQFVAAHPMAGTEFSGPLAAHAGLFSSRTAVICDAEDSGPEHLARVEKIFSSLRMRLVRMKADEHDLQTAFVSHLSHISSFVLANTVLEKERDTRAIFDLAGGGFESTVRLAKSSPAMWSPIFEQNCENVLLALDSYIRHLQEFAASLRQNDFAQAEKLMKNANQIGRVLHSVSQAGTQSESQVGSSVASRLDKQAGSQTESPIQKSKSPGASNDS